MYIFIILLLLLALLYLFAILPRTSRREQMRPFLHTQFAHRGYHCAALGIAENSMPAFRAAISHGYGIELDLHLTKDGHVVVFHDDDLFRMCGSKQAIEELTLLEVRRFHLGSTTEQIPLFTDVLTLINGQVPLLIELKLPNQAIGVCEAAYNILMQYRGPYLIQSFNTMGLHWFRQNAPDLLRGQLSSNLTKKKSAEPWILRFFVQHLLSNFLARPDFISYKLKDLPTVSISILQKLLHTPTAVWTLRTEEALQAGIAHYDMQIFEKNEKNY